MSTIPPPAALAQPVTLPPSIAEAEQVQSVRTPARLTYDFIPGSAAAQYLQKMKDKVILGQRSEVDGAVFVPPRGVDPRNGTLMHDYVELAHTGHVGSFCVTNIPIPGRDDLTLPYVSAWIFIDGADIGFIGLVADCDPSDVRIGSRVEAVWRPDDELGATAENIKYWRLLDEEPLPFEQSGSRRWRAAHQDQKEMQ